MSEITRTAQTIAAEIIGIKETASATLKSIATSAAIEIGKRLKEAKSLVTYGEWGDWLRDNVDYSERTAQNLMKLAEESARGSFAPLAELSYTQALQLIGLPAEDRAAILEDNDVAAMSTRELQDMIEEYKAKNAAMQLTIEQLQEDADTVDVDAVHAASNAMRDTDAAKVQAEDERHAREREAVARKSAEEKAAKATAETAKLKGEVDTAKKVQQRLEDELEKLRAEKQTEITEPQALADVPATVGNIIPEETQAELEELREYKRGQQALAEDAAAALKREGAAYMFKITYEEFIAQFKRIREALFQVGPDKREQYTKAMLQALHNMRVMLDPELAEEKKVDV